MKWFKELPWAVRALLVLVVGVVIIALFSSLGDDDDDDDESLAPPSAPVAAAQVPAADPGPITAAAVGNPLTYEGLTITAAMVKRGESLLDEQYSCAGVTYANGGEDEVRLSPFDWKLQTPTGTVLNPSPWGSDDQLPYGEVAAGGSAQGDVCFEIDVEDGGELKLIYEPSFWSDDRLTWTQRG